MVVCRGVGLFALSFLFALSAAAQSADLFVTKTAPATASVGSNITFVVNIGNNGPDDATSANLTDVLPADVTFVSYTQPTGPTFTCSTPAVGSSGTITCSLGTFAAGAAAEFDIVVNVSAPAAGTTLINTASISSDTTDDNGENNSSISGTSVPGGNLADVRILKSGPSAAPPNTDVSFTITVHNDGPNDATNVSFIDTLPSSVPPASGPMTFVSFNQNSGPAFNCGVPGTTTTCSIATFPNGSTATFTLVGHIPSSATPGTTYTNQVTMTSDNDPNPDNDTSATTVTVSSVDVGVTKSGPASAIAGGPTFDYVITLSNGGPDTATDASFNDALPAGIDFVSYTQNTGPAATCSTPLPNTNGSVACTIALLGNGASAQFTVTVQAEPTVANGTQVTNTAIASTSSADTNPNNDTSSASTTISAQADMSIVKSGPATAFAGTNITYTITATNNGPSNAANVSWTDTLPAGTTFVSESQTTGPTFTCTTGATISCNIASLVPGASATFSVTAHISPTAADGSTLSNTAVVSTTTFDGNANNNSSTVATAVKSQAEVNVLKNGPTAASAGSNITYTVIVSNAGPANATNVTLTDALPPGTTFVSESQPIGSTFTCTTGQTIVCTIPSFPNSSAIFQITVKIAANVPNGTTITNTATVTATNDTFPSNNTQSASTLIAANADLSVTKNGPASTPSNTDVTYTVTAANAGSADAANVSLSETVPAGMTFVSVNQTTGPAFACSGTGPIVCTIASFAAGASATFQFTFNVPLGAQPGTPTSNTVTISATTPDPNPANNSATVNTTIGESIPTLSPLAMALLAIVLAMIGWVAARR